MSEQNPFANHQRPVPAAGNDNPFKAPTAHVDDLRPGGDGTLLGEPARLAAGRGSGWWSGGWDLFREATGPWIGIAVALMVFIIVISLIPILGPIATYIITPVIGGGLMLGCRSLENGDGLSFGHLFAGFQKNFAQLALVGLLYLVGIVAIFLVIAAFAFGGGVGAAMMSGKLGAGSLSFVLIGVLVGAGLGIPLAMALWFAPALVVLNDLGAVEAMKLSFRGCWRNIMPFLVYGLVGFVLAIVATIPLGLGWLALMPTMICTTYVAYREIFLA